MKREKLKTAKTINEREKISEANKKSISIFLIFRTSFNCVIKRKVNLQKEEKISFWVKPFFNAKQNNQLKRKVDNDDDVVVLY